MAVSALSMTVTGPVGWRERLELEAGFGRAFAGTLYFWLRKHNCHVNRCWRLAWHPHPDHGHPVCKKHHPDGHSITA